MSAAMKNWIKITVLVRQVPVIVLSVCETKFSTIITSYSIVETELCVETKHLCRQWESKNYGSMKIAWMWLR